MSKINVRLKIPPLRETEANETGGRGAAGLPAAPACVAPQPLHGRDCTQGPSPEAPCLAQAPAAEAATALESDASATFLSPHGGCQICQIIHLNFSVLVCKVRIKNSPTVDVCSVLSIYETLLGKLQHFSFY